MGAVPQDSNVTVCHKLISTMNLHQWADVATLAIAVLAFVVATWNFIYVRRRDFEVDTRSGWIEIHKAMVNLQVQRGFVLLLRGQMGAYTQGGSSLLEERMRDYVLATAQLRGQLARLNDDPLIIELSKFLADNKQLEQWQTDAYEMKFVDFALKVAMKSRPK